MFRRIIMKEPENWFNQIASHWYLRYRQFYIAYPAVTNLANELRKLRLKYDKNEIKLHLAENLVLQLAVKYVHPGNDDNDTVALPSDLPVKVTDKPDIIITEIFSL